MSILVQVTPTTNPFICRTPYRPDKDTKFRCGNCKPCMDRRRLEWGNRLVLEQYGKDYRPFFVTLTYRPDTLPDNYHESIKLVQKYLKRLRKKVGTCRYFLANENGDKNGRIHSHMILWNKELASMSLIEQWKIQFDTWANGRLESTPVRSPAAFYYTTKYITKNLTSQNTGQWSRINGKYVHKGRLFTWSNKPRFGDEAYSRWEYLVRNSRYPSNVLPPNWFNGPIFGKIQKIYVPSDYYKKTVKSMGYSFDIDPHQENIRQIEKLCRPEKEEIEAHLLRLTTPDTTTSKSLGQ